MIETWANGAQIQDAQERGAEIHDAWRRQMTSEAPERHKDTQRNLILNRAVTDLDQIIGGHDPELDCPIGIGVWNRLDKMACEIEATHQQALEAAEARGYARCMIDWLGDEGIPSEQKDSE